MMESFKKTFDESGYIIIKDFFALDNIQAALQEYKNIAISFQASTFGEHFFSAHQSGPQSTDKYFFDSANEIQPFFNSLLKENPHVLSLDLSIEKNLLSYLKVINKIGHNLHGKNTFFHDLFFNDTRLRDIAKVLGYDEICTSVFQTTLISKSLAKDSEYDAHQDGSYIGANGKVLAYWIPLTPAHRDNGCLWGIPGSHHLPLTTQYRKTQVTSYHCHYVGKQMEFDLSKKVYLEVNPGDLLIFSGNFVHGSSPAKVLPNTIQDFRIALTYHLGPTQYWDELIWLKLNKENSLRIYI
jgi:phytanoyl-CoA hydroxylase